MTGPFNSVFPIFDWTTFKERTPTCYIRKLSRDQWFKTTVQIFNSCTSRPDICQCMVVQTSMDDMSKGSNPASGDRNFDYRYLSAILIVVNCCRYHSTRQAPSHWQLFHLPRTGFQLEQLIGRYGKQIVALAP